MIAWVDNGSLIPRFGRARRDERLAVLEGFHPLKHALRFDAQMVEAVCTDRAQLDVLAERLAPDLGERMGELVREIQPEVFDKPVPPTPTAGGIGLARRPLVDVDALLAAPSDAPFVLLENPRDLANIGTCVRVA